MKIHWYWPFARPEEISWADATCNESDSMLIQVIDRAAAPEATNDSGRVRIIRDLPDVDRSSNSRARWLASRAATYTERRRKRSASWAATQPDVAHVHYLNRFTDLSWGSTRPELLVLSVHDVVPHLRRGPRLLEDKVLRHVYGNVDALIVHHATLRSQLINDFGIDGDKIHVIGHQVFPVAEEMRSDTAPEASVPRILFFGALRPNKGVSVLCEAIEMIPESQDFEFHFAGRGDSGIEKRLTDFADRQSRVTTEIGFVDHGRKAELFRSASVVVLPYTDFSSQSGVLHDAYGHNRPVVVTEVGALGDTVREDGTGLVVPPSDPKALAKALQHLLADTESAAKMGTAAGQVAVERSPQAVGQQLRLVYTQIAG